MISFSHFPMTAHTVSSLASLRLPPGAAGTAQPLQPVGAERRTNPGSSKSTHSTKVIAPCLLPVPQQHAGAAFLPSGPYILVEGPQQ